jgi:thiol-disulfide isomerase/thioredoxin
MVTSIDLTLNPERIAWNSPMTNVYADSRLTCFLYVKNRCASCKHIGPTFEGLSDQWSHKLTFVLVDVDDKAFGFEVGCLSV